jgi:hypothetical protein
VLAGLVVVVGAGCSPTLNWRIVGLTDRWTATFPCKPERRERVVPIGTGDPVRMAQWACEAGGATFVLAMARVEGAPQAASAVDAWLQSTVDNAQAQVERRALVTLPAAAGGTNATRASLAARTGAAEGRRVEVLAFARASDVFQLAVVSTQQTPPAAVEGFFEGLTRQRD